MKVNEFHARASLPPAKEYLLSIVRKHGEPVVKIETSASRQELNPCSLCSSYLPSVLSLTHKTYIVRKASAWVSRCLLNVGFPFTALFAQYLCSFCASSVCLLFLPLSGPPGTLAATPASKLCGGRPPTSGGTEWSLWLVQIHFHWGHVTPGSLGGAWELWQDTAGQWLHSRCN
jgi:hypothetical protein